MSFLLTDKNFPNSSINFTEAADLFKNAMKYRPTYYEIPLISQIQNNDSNVLYATPLQVKASTAIIPTIIT